MEQGLVEQRDVVPQRLPGEDFGFGPPTQRRHPQHLPQQGVVVGQVFQPIPVGIQAQAHHPQHQDLPQVHAGAAGGFLAGQNGRFEQGEDLRL